MGGNISHLEINFTMVSTDGTERHVHSIYDFTPNAVVPVILDEHGAKFTGLTDIKTNGKNEWDDVQTYVTIYRHDTIKISLSADQTDKHFRGQPIYGVVNLLRNPS